jgi:hypothetical protein
MNVFHTTAALETEKPGPTDLPSQHFGAKPTDLDVWAARRRFCTYNSEDRENFLRCIDQEFMFKT